MGEQAVIDNSKQIEHSAPAESKSMLSTLKDSTAKFMHAVAYESVESPLQSLQQFANQTSITHLPELNITKPDDSASSTAGAFVGTVLKYAATSKVVHSAFNASEARAASETAETLLATTRRVGIETATVGAVGGFLTPVDTDKDYWKEKGIAMATSAGAFGTMGATSAAIGKTSFLRSENALTKAVAINGLAGIAGGTVESALDAKLHGRDISLDQTVQTAGSYALFGAAFGGVAHVIGANPAESIETKTAKSQTKSDLQTTSLNTANEGPWGSRVVVDEAPRLTLRDHAARAVQAVHEQTMQLGRSVDDSMARISSMLSMDGLGGMQLAYEGAGARSSSSNGFRSARPYFSNESAPDPIGGNRMLSVAHQAHEPGGFQPGGRNGGGLDGSFRGLPIADENAPLARGGDRATAKPANINEKLPAFRNEKIDLGKPTRTFGIQDVLSKTERGSELLLALDKVADENPAFLKGVRAASPETMGGRDTVVIELADGKYKNAVLKFTTIFGQAQDTLTPNQWDAEWGHRPYDAPLLSKVHEVELGSGDLGYVYVQEKGEGATKVDAFYDAHDDASFARDANDPDLEKIMEQLAARQEEFVDPGSRQLAWSALKGRLVLVDYAAVMRSADIPAEWRAKTEAGADKQGSVTSRNSYSEHNDPNEEPDFEDEVPASYSNQVGDASVEDRRYEFVRRPATKPEIDVQNQIAEQIFGGESDRDMAPYIEIVCKDSLASIGKSAKEAIKWTREILKKEQLL